MMPYVLLCARSIYPCLARYSPFQQLCFCSSYCRPHFRTLVPKAWGKHGNRKGLWRSHHLGSFTRSSSCSFPGAGSERRGAGGCTGTGARRWDRSTRDGRSKRSRTRYHRNAKTEGTASRKTGYGSAWSGKGETYPLSPILSFRHTCS